MLTLLLSVRVTLELSTPAWITEVVLRYLVELHCAFLG